MEEQHILKTKMLRCIEVRQNGYYDKMTWVDEYDGKFHLCVGTLQLTDLNIYLSGWYFVEYKLVQERMEIMGTIKVERKVRKIIGKTPW